MTQSQHCDYEYTVQRGDSFYLIAHRLGVPLKDLLDANSTINPARLMVGDVLCIPATGDTTPSGATTAGSATTAPTTGNTPKPDTSTATPIETPATPEPIEADDTGNLDTPAADLNAPATPGGELPDIGVCPEADRYTVLAGETVADIQIKKNINRHTIEVANPKVDLDHLQTGQVLCIPEEIPCNFSETYRLGREETMETTALLLNVSLAALLRANPCLAPSDFREGVCVRVPED